MDEIMGKKVWIIGDGFMSDTEKGNYVSHEAVCVLNVSGKRADIDISVYFEYREPMKNFKAVCENDRTNHIRLDRLKNTDGAAIPKEVPYALVVKSSEPIVVQHSRMDVSLPEMTLMTTIAY